MINNKIDLLREKARAFSEDGKWVLTEEIIKNVETSLGIVLPDDFRELCKICRYDVIGRFEFFSFNSGVIEETKYWREHENLPNKYVVLCWDGTSAIIMQTISNKECKVIWCHCNDFFNLCESGSLESDNDVYNSFTDFYEFLLNREEEYRAESEKRN